MRGTLWLRGAVSAALTLLILIVVYRDVEVQTGLVALVLIAVLPWLGAILESVEVGGAKVKYRQLERRVDEQARQLDDQQIVINELVVYSIAGYIFDHLSFLYHRSRSGEEYLFRDNEPMKRDLRFLRDHGYLEHFHVADLKDGDNLIHRLRLTPVGMFLVEQREQLSGRSAAVNAVVHDQHRD